MSTTSNNLSYGIGAHRRGTDSYVDLIEALLQPLVYSLSILGIGLSEEGTLNSVYLTAALLSFLLSFPAPSRLDHSYGKMGLSLLAHWLWHAIALLVLAYVTGYIDRFSNEALRTWLLLVPALSIAAQLGLCQAMPALRMLAGGPQRAIIVGFNPQGLALAQKLKGNPRLHTSLLGFFDSRKPERLSRQTPNPPPLLGAIEDVADFVNREGINCIYLTLPMSTQQRVLHLLNSLKDTTASIYFVPDIFITDLIQGRMRMIEDMPAVAVCETPFTGINGLIKRGSDIVMSFLLLTLAAPLLIGIALAVKLTSPGPVIFKQRRYGLDGKEILVYKFRSMSVTEDGHSIRQASRDDARFTPIGAFLRRSSLDELPQLINVLQGRMSLVGPRPHAVAHNELYRKLIKGYMVRHKVKPGITGWAQVNGYRGETETVDKMSKRIDYDLDYLRHWSLTFDLKIIVKTVFIVAKASNAH